jgi:hypothetical protein
MPTDTQQDDPRTAREIVTEHLRARAGAVPSTELRDVLRRAKPSTSHSLADVTLRSMAKAGLVTKTGAGWALTDTGQRGVAPSPAAPAAASNEVAKGETPAQEAAPPAARASSTLTVRVTAPMRARLEELLADGFHGDSVEEVAERYLARSLRAFNNAN